MTSRLKRGLDFALIWMNSCLRQEIITKFYESAGLARPSDWLDVRLGGDVVEGDDYELDEITTLLMP